ncbi:MAG: thiosulfate oxidation carrier protein SoxY [Rubritepida sp.]|nr:thiosulfate oxidation carrier protein SoxY [Rubritepida sp.]MCU0944526.1 thiosulfate oxidation carrier protein SoxY [Rubritepida sp.]
MQSLPMKGTPPLPAPTRRRAAGLFAAAAAVALLPRPSRAQVAAATEAALARVRAGRTPVEGRITLRAPAIAENGNAVPLTVQVESPMTAADHVTRIHVFANGNPTPEVASFQLTPAMGRAQVDTRIRLGQTQDVIVLAETSDGGLFTARAEVKVTIGGCGG